MPGLESDLRRLERRFDDRSGDLATLEGRMHTVPRDIRNLQEQVVKATNAAKRADERTERMARVGRDVLCVTAGALLALAVRR